MKHILLTLTAILIMGVTTFSQDEGPIKVEVEKIDGKWTLLRGGKPYYIKGAGGQVYMDRVAEYGGNSIRTWSIDDAKEFLDEAHKYGLTVMMGLWVGHERHGFDYDDPSLVKSQLNRFTTAVKSLKDHPALLFWGVGNEMDLQYKNVKVWDAVQDICAMIHREDPNHPTSLVTAGFHQEVMDEILKTVKDLDIYGINTYGDCNNTPERIATSGWTGPYTITEWGPTGHWEVAKTEWGQPIEETSKEKGEVYMERYNIIKNDSANCIGSYVFVWGNKQETTSTWYGMFSKDGHEAPAIDAVHKGWSGKWPSNRVPFLDSIFVDGKTVWDNIHLEAGQSYGAKVYYHDDDNTKIVWKMYEESTDRKSGGDAEAEPLSIPGTFKGKDGGYVTLKAPKTEGEYRIFCFIYDTDNNYAYANIPIKVNPPDPNAPQMELVKPIYIDKDNWKKNGEVLELE